MTKTIGVISIKGGVGKTTTVSNLGALMSSQFDKKVLMVDANFSGPSLGLHLGVVNPKQTLHDVMTNEAHITTAIYEHEAGFHVLPGALMGKKVNSYALKSKLEEIKHMYDVILIDSSPNLNDEMLATMVASDEILVVSSPDYPTLSATLHAVKVAKEKKVPITGLVLNKVRGKSFELSLKDIEEASDVPVLAVLKDDINVLEALAASKVAALHKPKTNVSIEYSKLAGALLGQNVRDPRMLNRVRDIFIKDFEKQAVNRQVLVSNRK
ncbi:MAG: AAA family ATPase [Nanoarchaeota archaeon]|nr:AAA family ATPase [Nanoarchaeota archaeon]MBU1703787.1 AAA family ATPase [Nanoarchaeota archaeon]